MNDKEHGLLVDFDQPTTLSYILNAAGLLETTVMVRMKNGDEFYLGNSFDDVAEANHGGRPYVAHQVLSMKPVEIQINPDDVSTVRAFPS